MQNIRKNCCRITPHIFRHTFCSNMLNDGVSLPNTQAMMGHENPEYNTGRMRIPDANAGYMRWRVSTDSVNRLAQAFED